MLFRYVKKIDLPWGDERKRKFATNVGLITTRGKEGDNIMACEWTHHISYSPGFIAVCTKKHKRSAKNILKSKEFGVNLASIDQATLVHIAGTNHADELDKIKALKELGYKFSEGKKINTLMVDGSSMQAECKLVKVVDFGGSHNIYIGQIVELYPLSNKDSLIYYGGKFYNVGKVLKKPTKSKLEKIEKVTNKYKLKNI